MICLLFPVYPAGGNRCVVRSGVKMDAMWSGGVGEAVSGVDYM